PEKVRDELAARAASQGRSMQEFLRSELQRLASRPSVDAWLQRRVSATILRWQRMDGEEVRLVYSASEGYRGCARYTPAPSALIAYKSNRVLEPSLLGCATTVIRSPGLYVVRFHP